MTSLPAHPSDLTPVWLSSALGTEVTGVEVLHHSFATNQRARIGLTYATPGAGPASLFVKLAPLDEAHRSMVGATGMGLREVQFYADVAATSGLPVPGCSFAAADEDRFVLLLEDLAARGCAFSDGDWGVDADAAAVALEDLARFHGRFHRDAERDAVAPWLRPAPDQAAVRRPGSAGTAGLMRTVLDENADALPPDYIAIGELYVEHHERCNELWHGGPQTLIHGDLHIGNVYLDARRVGFIDWGLCRVSTPLRDVSYFLTMSVAIEDRRAHGEDLLRGYLDALHAAGGPDIGFADAWAQHRVQAAYTVIATFLAYTPSYRGGDGVPLGADLITRANAALTDLDVVDALRATL
jgi:hypothetical protein